MSGLGNLSQEGNHWRKPISYERSESLIREFQALLEIPRGGLLTANQRARLLNLKKPSEGQDEKKLWFDIRHSVHTAFLDMRLLCRVASDSQMQAMFVADDVTNGFHDGSQTSISPTVSKNYLELLAACIFFDAEPRSWKDHLASDLIIQSATYFGRHPKFNTKLHQRIISDAIDIAKSL
jgi:hypothetical protein